MKECVYVYACVRASMCVREGGESQGGGGGWSCQVPAALQTVRLLVGVSSFGLLVITTCRFIIVLVQTAGRFPVSQLCECNTTEGLLNRAIRKSFLVVLWLNFPLLPLSVCSPVQNLASCIYLFQLGKKW